MSLVVHNLIMFIYCRWTTYGQTETEILPQFAWKCSHIDLPYDGSMWKC